MEVFKEWIASYATGNTGIHLLLRKTLSTVGICAVIT